MSWTYRQRTGELVRDGQVVAHGYSGHGEGRNCPEKQAEKRIGPIPQGRWRIGPPFLSDRHGPYVLPLGPLPGTQTLGRSGFLIHGDSRAHPGEASLGCIILPRETRELIWASADRVLEVVEGTPVVQPAVA